MSQSESKELLEMVTVDSEKVQAFFAKALERVEKEKEEVARNLSQKEADIRQEVELMNKKVGQTIGL